MEPSRCEAFPVGQIMIEFILALRCRGLKRCTSLVVVVAAVFVWAGCRRDRATKAESLAEVWGALRTHAVSKPSVATPPEPPVDDEPEGKTLEEQRAILYRRMRERLLLPDDVMRKVEAIVNHSKFMGQGNPAVTEHPMSRKQCREIRRQAGLPYYVNEAICGALNMVPIYDPAAGQTAADARVCIDQYEFPNLACEYPVVFVRASEAVALCEAVGKRLCDAHEWEGACAGALRPAEREYAWGKSRMQMKWVSREGREVVWAYGSEKDHNKCATGSHKSKKCGGGGWKTCGSNTYPAGAFPACVSRFGVFDQHGNAAEHMNLPMGPEQLASKGVYGETEMKGSWFAFQQHEAHEDDCRWRAPDWHVSKVRDPDSHRNYHLGFRCCKDVGAWAPR